MANYEMILSWRLRRVSPREQLREMEESQNQSNTLAEGIDITTRATKAVIGDSKVTSLRNFIEEDIWAADFKWSLFVAACQSYRYDSCLKPFPPQFITRSGHKDIDSLRDVVDTIPALSLLAQRLYEPNIYQAISTAIELLYWVLIHLKDSRMKLVPKSEFSSVMKNVECVVSVQPPNLIFQLTSSQSSQSELRWQHLSKRYKTLFAFHGSRLDNFHSILHYGLQQHLNKNSLFGHGIYLSSELSVSLPYSPTGHAWGCSILGSEMSCVALCEIIDHPDVKCQDKESDRSRSIATDSIAGAVPEKYFVVLNSDLVRVRYLLVYSNHSEYSRSLASKSILGWFSRHKMLTCAIGYFIFLASVGLSNSPAVQRYINLLLKRVGF